MKAAILVETPRTGAGLDFIYACRKNKIEPIIFIQEPENVPNWVMDDYINLEVIIKKVNTYNLEALVEGCQMIMKKYELVAVLSLYEYSTVVAAEAANLLGLNSPNSEVVSIFRNKFSFREFVSENSLDTVKYQKLNSLLEINEEDLALDFPVVMKPLNLTGSAFVRKCNNLEDMTNTFNEIMNLTEYTGQVVSKSILVEEYIEGNEYSVEVLNGEIIAVVRKYTSEKGFIEVGHDVPAKLTNDDETLILNRVNQLINISSYHFGLLHIEIKISKGELHFIEVNPRAAGGRIPELIRHVYNFDLIEEYLISIVSGIKRINKENTGKIGSIRFTCASNHGVIKDYIPIELSGNIIEYKFYKEKNIPFSINYSNKDRIVHVLSVSASKEENELEIKDFLDKLSIKEEYSDEYSNFK